MCKVCKSIIADEINEKILANVGYIEISKWLLSRGVKISHMTLKRHHDNGHCGAKRQHQVITAAPVLEYQNVMAMSNEELLEKTRLLIKAVYVAHLQILSTRQQEHLNGFCRYPQNELNGLKTILECLSLVSRGADNCLAEKTKQNTTISTQTLKEIREQVYGIYE